MPADTPRFTVFMLLKTMPAWLALARDRRNEVADQALSHALEKSMVRLRHFDAEAFTGRCTDVVVFEADDLVDFYYVVERLRDTPFFSVPYFEVVEIIPTIENGFRQFEQAQH